MNAAFVYLLTLPWPNNPPQDFIPNQSSFPTWNQLDGTGQFIIIGLIVVGFIAWVAHAGRKR